MRSSRGLSRWTSAGDERRGHTVDDVEALLQQAGFSGVESVEVVQRTFDTVREHLDAVKARGTSVLAMMPREAFEAGLRALDDHVRRHPGDPWLLTDRLSLTVGYKT